MTLVPFDTLKLAEKLHETAGLCQEHAAGFSRTLASAMGSAELATKPDLRDLELRLTSELTLVKWMLTSVLAFLIAIVVKLFVH